MADNNTDNSRNEVEIDLDKYMALIDKLDKSEDMIKEMQLEAAEAKKRLAPPQRKFSDIFLDDNDVNEKAIIGFISFALMTIFGICDLVTAFKSVPRLDTMPIPVITTRRMSVTPKNCRWR